jgi:transposase
LLGLNPIIGGMDGGGYTLKDAAKILGVGYGTLARYLTTNATLRARYYEARARAKRRKG